MRRAKLYRLISLPNRQIFLTFRSLSLTCTYFLAVICSFALGGCQTSPELEARQRYVMGTLGVVEFSTSGIQSPETVFEAWERVEADLSTYRPSSLVAKLNQGEKVEASELLLDILLKSSEMTALTEGLFDVRREGGVSRKGNALALTASGRLDFGGIGKGYALDVAKKSLHQKPRTQAAHHGVGRMAIAGDIFCFNKCAISIKHPDLNQKKPLALFETCKKETAVSTSGSYYQFEENEKNNHLVHPRSKKPQVETRSITVVGKEPNSTLDALATALAIAAPKQRDRIIAKFDAGYLHLDFQNQLSLSSKWSKYACQTRYFDSE